MKNFLRLIYMSYHLFYIIVNNIFTLVFFLLSQSNFCEYMYVYFFSIIFLETVDVNLSTFF